MDFNKSPKNCVFLAIADSFVIALNTEYLGSCISPNNSLNTLLPLPITLGAFGSTPAYLPLVTVLAKVFNTSGVSAPAVRLTYWKAGSCPFGFVLGTLSSTDATIDLPSCSVISFTVLLFLCVNLEYLWKSPTALFIASSVGW